MEIAGRGEHEGNEVGVVGAEDGVGSQGCGGEFEG